MFGLREWEEEGFMPQAQDADDPSYDPAAVKKARQPSARVHLPASHLFLLLLFILHGTAGPIRGNLSSSSALHNLEYKAAGMSACPAPSILLETVQ